MIKADKCFHIKLGRSDVWSSEAIEANKIYFGYHRIPHELCQTKDEVEIRAGLEKVFYASPKSTISNRLREILTFYDEPASTLWITFFAGCLYYATAKETVEVDSEGRKYRETNMGWSPLNQKGETISEFRLRGDLVTKKYYRGTICTISEPLLQYLLRVINCEDDPIHRKIYEAQQEIEKLIRRLGPKDFELLVDMIMQRSGLLRESSVGGTIKDIDYAGSHLLTGRYYYAQAKSRTTLKEVQKYLNIFVRMNVDNPGAVYLYFLNEDSAKYESLAKRYCQEYDDFEYKIYGAREVGQLAAKLGLLDWVLDRT